MDRRIKKPTPSSSPPYPNQRPNQAHYNLFSPFPSSPLFLGSDGADLRWKPKGDVVRVELQWCISVFIRVMLMVYQCLAVSHLALALDII